MNLKADVVWMIITFIYHYPCNPSYEELIVSNYFSLLLASSLQYSLYVIIIRRNSINTKRWFITQKLCVGNEKGDLEVVIRHCCGLFQVSAYHGFYLMASNAISLQLHCIIRTYCTQSLLLFNMNEALTI